MEVDYLIVGAGLCGLLLADELLQAGCTVVVADDGVSGASRAAGGIINPVTGKRLVRAWMIDDLLPFALKRYGELEQRLHVPIVREMSIVELFATADERKLFYDKLEEEKDYLRAADDGQWQQYFRYNYGAGVIRPCLLADIGALLDALLAGHVERGRVVSGSSVRASAEGGSVNRCAGVGVGVVSGSVEWDDCIISDEGVEYKNIKARKMICCEGAGGERNPWFGMLPWSKDKGEALIVEVKSPSFAEATAGAQKGEPKSVFGLPTDCIYKQGISMVPWRDGLWWVGASHDWKYESLEPTMTFRKTIEDRLAYWLKLPFEVVDHVVAARPANFERKPFVGLHPKYGSVGILNGMGGKGVSMAPYFARQLAMHLVHGAPLLPEVDVRRFERVLLR